MTTSTTKTCYNKCTFYYSFLHIWTFWQNASKPVERDAGGTQGGDAGGDAGMAPPMLYIRGKGRRMCVCHLAPST